MPDSDDDDRQDFMPQRIDDPPIPDPKPVSLDSRKLFDVVVRGKRTSRQSQDLSSQPLRDSPIHSGQRPKSLRRIVYGPHDLIWQTALCISSNLL